MCSCSQRFGVYQERCALSLSVAIITDGYRFYGFEFALIVRPASSLQSTHWGSDWSQVYRSFFCNCLRTRIISGLRLVLAGKPQNFKLPRHTESWLSIRNLDRVRGISPKIIFSISWRKSRRRGAQYGELYDWKVRWAIFKKLSLICSPDIEWLGRSCRCLKLI